MRDRTDIIETTPVHDEVVTQRTVVDPAPAPVVEPAATVAQHEAVSYDPYAGRRRSTYKLVQAIWLVVGLIETLLLIRFVLRALGANPAAGFAQFIYGITTPLVAPFLNLFGTPATNGSALELNTIVAMIVYALVGWLIAKLVWLAIGETRSALTTHSNVVDTHVR